MRGAPVTMTIELTPPTATFDHSRHRGIPPAHTLGSLLGLGPMPFTKVLRCHELVREARAIVPPRPTGDLTNAEDSLRRSAESRAEEWAHREMAKTVERTVSALTALRAEAHVLGQRLADLNDRHYVGPHGESCTAAEARSLHDESVTAVQADEQVGARNHRRVPPGTKKLMTKLLGLDLVVLTFLMAKFLNVDLQGFWLSSDGIIKAVTALVFAVLGTVGVASAMKMFGVRHRVHRGPHGWWDFGNGSRGALTVELALCGGVAVALSTAVSWRFVMDGRGGNPVLTTLMAVLFGLVMTGAAVLAYLSEFADGSLRTEALDVLAPQLHGSKGSEIALRGKQQVLHGQMVRLNEQLAREGQRIRTGAMRKVLGSTADRAIRYARSHHQQAGPGGALPAPRLDLGGLDLALRQASAWTAPNGTTPNGTMPTLYTAVAAVSA